MFEELFTRRAAIARHYATPLLEERLRYLVHCARAGAQRGTLRAIAAHQVNLVRLLGLRAAEPVCVTRVTVLPSIDGEPVRVSVCSVPPDGVFFTVNAPFARSGAAARSSSKAMTNDVPVTVAARRGATPAPRRPTGRSRHWVCP